MGVIQQKKRALGLILVSLVLLSFSGSLFSAIETDSADPPIKNLIFRMGLGSGVNFGGTPGIGGELIVMKYLGVFGGIGVIDSKVGMSFAAGLFLYPLGNSGDLQPRIGFSMGKGRDLELKGVIGGGLQWNWWKRMWFSFDLFYCIVNRNPDYSLDKRKMGQWAMGLGVHYQF